MERVLDNIICMFRLNCIVYLDPNGHYNDNLLVSHLVVFCFLCLKKVFR